MGRRVGESGPASLQREVVVVVVVISAIPRIKAVGERVRLNRDAIVDSAVAQAAAGAAKGCQTRAAFGTMCQKVRSVACGVLDDKGESIAGRRRCV